MGTREPGRRGAGSLSSNATVTTDVIPPMPAGVAGLLRRCFEPNPANRPHTLRDCAAALAEVYKAETGDALPPRRTAGRRRHGRRPQQPCAVHARPWEVGRGRKASSARRSNLTAHHVAATYNRGLLRWRAAKCTDADVLVSLREIEGTTPTMRVCNAPWPGCGWRAPTSREPNSHFERAIGTDQDGDARQGLEQAQPLADRTAGYPRTFDGQTGSVQSIACRA